MTNYGTIPTSSAPPATASRIEYLTRAKERIKEGLGTRRSWREMFDFHAFKLPTSTDDAVSRMKTNVAYFQMNYAIVVLLVIFLSLISHPISLIVLVAITAAWLYFYFLRDEPIVIFGRMITDQNVMIGLSVITIVLLLFTGATTNILSSLLVGVVVVLIHATVRKTDDLCTDPEAAGGLLRPPASRCRTGKLLSPKFHCEKKSQVVAFATFANHQSAMAALHSLNGVKFDPQTGSTLHIELARSNSRRKNKPGSGPYVVIDNRTKSATDNRESSGDDASGDSDSDDPPENHDSGNQDDSAMEKSLGKAADGNNASAPENEQVEKTADGACSTLFIANLGPNCTQDELKQVISQYPGFNILKLRARGGMPVAFADFEGIDQATAAMNALQGISLPSSDRGGMHIEYARSKMRKA